MGAAAKRTENGFEVAKTFAAFIVSAIVILSFLGGVTAASVRASDKIKDAVPRAELHDSLKAIRSMRYQDSLHDARQDTAIAMVGRQVLGLLCEQYKNPKPFCGTDAVQARIPR